MDEEKKAKRIIREELGKLSKLTWGQRIGYIWDYYKPLMVIVIVVICVISLVSTIYHNLQLNHLLNVYAVNCNSLGIDADAIEAGFVEQIGGIGEKDVVMVNTSMTLDDSESQQGMANSMKFTALVSAAEMDVLLMDEATFQQFQEMDYFLDLREVFSEEQLEECTEILVKNETSGAAVALDLSDSPILNHYDAYFGEKAYGAVIKNSKRLELCDDFLMYLYIGEPVAGDDPAAPAEAETELPEADSAVPAEAETEITAETENHAETNAETDLEGAAESSKQTIGGHENG